MARQNVVFDNFIMGDSGRRRPLAYHYGRRKLSASYGHFRGLNVMRYINGGIGPRPPFVNLNMPTQNTPFAPGNLLFTTWVPAYQMVCAFFSDNLGNTRVYVARTGLQTTSVIGGVPPGVWNFGGVILGTALAAVAHGNNVIVSLANNNSSGAAFSPVVYFNPLSALSTNSPGAVFTVPLGNNFPAGANFLVAYKEFVVAAVGTTGLGQTTTETFGSNVLYFSDRFQAECAPATFIADFGPGTSWGCIQQVAVGTSEPISGLFVQKNSLAIAKVGGEWYTMTGAFDSGTIRKAEIGLDFQGVGAAVRQSNIWYPFGRDIGNFTGAQTLIEPLPDFPDAGPAVTSNNPINETSSSAYYAPAPPTAVNQSFYKGLSIPILGASDNPPWLAIAPLELTDEFMLVGASHAQNSATPNLQALIHHGAYGAGTAVGWTRHSLPYNSYTLNSAVAAQYVGNSLVWLIFSNNNGGVDTFQFDIRQEIPYAQPNGQTPAGDPRVLYADFNTGAVVTGSFSIPEWWEPDGKKAAVLGVVVDLDFDAAAWQAVANLGADPSSVVGFTMTVDALNLLSQDGIRTSQPQSWAPPQGVRTTPASGANMVRHRVKLRTGDQGAASGFQINFTNMRGIQIYRIVAVIDSGIAEEF